VVSSTQTSWPWGEEGGGGSEEGREGGRGTEEKRRESRKGKLGRGEEEGEEEEGESRIRFG